ncbi:hypothetical protein NC652_033863 [Populus alba x Populus x berolinensis]|uniref:Uncharacterized protein n=1 Tax=Populus alba x Populus x berolinensis TaxID=444605 RepID=A0AAD6LUP7_9ROSI|nr:hypothetical protein NC651_032792 [Populus alba x Populus x berolinensis]KAJ6880657.1 hypothetical protein NC652_033863 [Populus alba x Populus x berolinensis]KAJ6973563.1 hypothetical protein NC653_033790 [Populus alba x Populus x berolinensis]
MYIISGQWLHIFSHSLYCFLLSSFSFSSSSFIMATEKG